MSDPFKDFMDLWAPSVGVTNAFESWLLKEKQQQSHYIMPDIEGFTDTSGKYIAGRRAWREHLASTGMQEFGHGDLKRMTDRHQETKAKYREKMERATRNAPAVPMPTNARPLEPSRTSIRVAERLHGRPPPDRPTLIKIAMEERMRK